MSPLLKNVATLAIAFALGGFLLTWIQGAGRTLGEVANRAGPMMAFGVTIGAAIGLGLHAVGIQVVP